MSEPVELPRAFYEEARGGGAGTGDGGSAGAGTGDDATAAVFESTQLTAGPWSDEHQHGGPPAALLARAIEAASGIDGGQTTRLSFDILGPVPVAPLAITTRTLRPGKKVELIEATLTPAGDGAADARPAMRATAWRMRAEPTDAPRDDADPPPPPPDTGHTSSFSFWTAPVAYHRALTWSWIDGDIDGPGPAVVWTHLNANLIGDEPPTPLQRLLTMADAASGASAVLDWKEWSFVNVDLGIHLERPPRGEWMAMDARTRIGDSGAALCESTLFDETGRVGRSTASLLIARR